MNKLDNWLKSKLEDQKTSYDPIFWEDYKAFESSKNKGVYVFWVFPSLLLFLSGLTFLYFKGEQPTTESQLHPSVNVKAGFYSSLEKISEFDQNVNSNSFSRTPSSRQPHTNFILQTTKSNSKEKRLVSNHQIILEKHAAISRDYLNRYTDHDIQLPLKNKVSSSPYQVESSVSDISITTSLHTLEDSKSSNELMLKNKNADVIFLSHKINQLRMRLPVTVASTDFFSLRPYGPPIENWNASYAIKASSLLYPAVGSSGEQLLGGGIAFGGSWEYKQKWFFAGELGLNYRTGTFGVQIDHPTLVFEFEKSTSGYQILPTSAWYATSMLKAGRLIGPWSIYGGVGFNHLISVNGNLYQYQKNKESSGLPTFEEDKISSGKIGKEGFKYWIPALELGAHCNLTQKWALGVSLNYYPGGFIKKEHQSLYDYRSETYVQHEINNWNLLENNYHFSIYLKFRIE